MCIDACPTGAMAEDGALNPTRCVLYSNFRPGEFKDTAITDLIGMRVHGCDACQVACPRCVAPPRKKATRYAASPCTRSTGSRAKGPCTTRPREANGRSAGRRPQRIRQAGAKTLLDSEPLLADALNATALRAALRAPARASRAEARARCAAPFKGDFRLVAYRYRITSVSAKTKGRR